MKRQTIEKFYSKTIENYRKTIENKGVVSRKTTKKEEEVLSLLSDEFLTPKQVSIRLGMHISRVYAITKNLRKKGILTRNYETIEKSRGTFLYPSKNLHKIRLHGQEFNIKILYENKGYKKKVGSVIYIDGCTVKCYRESIEVYGNKSFEGEDPQQVTAESMKYWQRFFARLENDLKIIIMKERYQNIKLVNAHYSELNNEFAKECNIKAEKIKIYTREDGKLWFIIDNSFNLHEAETVHSQTAKEDMQEVVRPFFNDLRERPAPKVSELAVCIYQMQKQVCDLAECQIQTNKQIQLVISLLFPQINKKNEAAPVQESNVEGVDYIG